MGINQDFHPPLSASQPHKRKSKTRHLLLLAPLIIVAALIIFFNNATNSGLEARETPFAETVSVPPASVAEPVSPPVAPEPVIAEIRRNVPAGSSITALLGDYFSPQEIYQLNQQSHDVFPFTRICAGQPYCITTRDGEFRKFVYEIDENEQLIIRRDGDQVSLETQPIVYDVTTELIEGTISSSLFDAVAAINEDPKLAFMLSDIFQWDIDFILDIRAGDRFQALVEKRSRAGQAAGYGNILAAEFVNQGQVFRAVRFKDGEQSASYYNDDGENVRKAFLRAPLSFTRISSGYTMKRFHPITKTWKAHPAIDYVAPVGTPIKTVGEGSISRIGYTRANGNFIEVRHSNGYRSIYLHMKGFARGMTKNKRVAQGQVIGYLGGTGMATGPHLCFRMRHNGAPVNPSRLKVPAAKSISKANLAAFQAVAQPLLAQLDAHLPRRDQVAKLDLSLSTSTTGSGE